MYFPILRGRQYELLALRECVEKNILSNKIIPIVEPVKVSATYTKTMETFLKNDKQIVVIRNPQVGTWMKDLQKEDKSSMVATIYNQLEERQIIPGYYVTRGFVSVIKEAIQNGIPVDSMVILCNNPEYIDEYSIVMEGKTPRYNIIPDKGEFRRRIRTNRIMCEDHFPKQMRNVDYLEMEEEFFSSDHIYYEEDGYKGFSDYVIVGEEYNDTGFAPYAVAIHITFFDDKGNLKVAHFVSDTNDDISDPARKFAEANQKLVEWNNNHKLETHGIQEFIKAYDKQTYPGLGMLKKFSIMHHLEMMGKYLEEV